MGNLIRLLTEEDAPGYQELRLKCLKDSPLSWLSTEKEEKNYSVHFFASKIRSAIQVPIFGIYGYFEDGVLLGYAQLAGGYWTKKTHIASFFDVCVDSDHRRKGVATKLIVHLIEKAKSVQAIEQIHLRVNSKNKGAIAFYKKLGFKKIAEFPKGVKELDGSYQDEFVYSYLLKPA